MHKLEIDIKVSQLFDEIIKSFISNFELESSIYLWMSNFGLLPKSVNSKIESININWANWTKEAYSDFLKLSKKFDFIFGDFPFGMVSAQSKSPEDDPILETSNKLTQKWLWLYMVWSGFFSLQNKKPLIESLGKAGLYINACFNLPKNTLAPFTTLQPILILISHSKNEKIFLSELSLESDLDDIIWNYRMNHSSNLNGGIFTPIDSFIWFNQYKIQDKIKKLWTIYSEFDKISFSDIASVFSLKDDSIIEDAQNSIFFPSVWNSPILCDFQNLVITKKNYYQVKLDSRTVSAEYVSYFFRSELGSLIRSSLLKGEIIPHINKSDLASLDLPLPDIATQNNIIDTYRRFNKLKEWIAEVENELSINPITSWILEEMKNMEESIWRMKKHDFIASLVLRWESKTLEFKKCLGSIKEQNSNWYNLTKAILKTICAFLNTDGGILLVWVMDNWSIFWIENDTSHPFRSKDDYLKYLHNLLMDRIWWDYMQYIDYDIELVNENYVLIIQCKTSDSPVYYEDKFYIRTNPATDELKPRELVSYITSRFWK